MAVRVTSTLRQWTPQTEKKIDLALFQLSTDIHREASILAPKDKRNLVNSGRISRDDMCKYRILFGDSTVRYARRRHFENRKNPQTIGYLGNSGDKIARNFKKYLRGL